MTDWNTYYKQHLDRSPRGIVVKAVNLCKEKNLALDLGAGTLVESNFLLEAGFEKVVAVDSSPEIKKFAEQINDKRLEILISPYKDLALLPESYDLITAQYALPFYGASGFKEFIEKIISSLKKEGIFTGQFFGNRDGWNTAGKPLAFQTKEEALELLKGLEIIEFIEEEKDGLVASGEGKHWHIFHFITKK